MIVCFDSGSLDTVCVSKVKSHADDGMVQHGQVRREDRLGNDAADEAADFGRRRVNLAVIDARRNLSGVCGRWYPIILDLHRFFIAISRAVVNHDEGSGTAPDPLVWSCWCSAQKAEAVRNLAMLFVLLVLLLLLGLMMLLRGPTLLVFWLSGWPFLVLCIGLLGMRTLELVVLVMLSYPFSMNSGLVRG